MAERVDYPPGVGALSLFPSATLEECTTRRCAEGEGGGSVQMLSATVTLRSSHIGKGCDRDTYSVHSQRRICGNFIYAFF